MILKWHNDSRNFSPSEGWDAWSIYHGFMGLRSPTFVDTDQICLEGLCRDERTSRPEFMLLLSVRPRGMINSLGDSCAALPDMTDSLGASCDASPDMM